MKPGQVHRVVAAALLALLAVLGRHETSSASETVVYSQSFEDSDGGYTAEGNALWEWGTPSEVGPAKPNSGLKCWGTNISGNLPPGSEGAIISPPIAIPTLARGQVVRVRFFGWISIYDMTSRGEFMVSSDGVNWDSLAELFGNMSGEWQRYEFDISDKAGGNLFLKFRAYEGDYSPDYPGFYVDDVAITVYEGSGAKKSFTLRAMEDTSPYASCPWVYPWDGTDFVRDNDIYSVARLANREYTDFYLLQKDLVAQENVYRLEVREIESEVSFTDYAGLVAVDHDENVAVGPDDRGNVFAYRPEELVVPQVAFSNSGADVTSKIGSPDNSGFHAYADDFVQVDFGGVDVSLGARLVLRVKGFVQGEGAWKPYTGPPAVVVKTLDEGGKWVERGRLKPRFEWSECVFDLSPFLPDRNGEIKVRLESVSHKCKYHEIDFAGLSPGPEPVKAVRNLPLLSADLGGEDISSLLNSSDNRYVTMSKGGKFSLSFAEEPQTLARRSFLFVSEGYYIPQSSTFFIFTHDGRDWVMRDGFSLPYDPEDPYKLQTIVYDLSLFLPDPVGKYRVRVWQDYRYETAGIDYVALEAGGKQGTLTSAYYLPTQEDISYYVSAPDDDRVYSFYSGNRDRWTEFEWTGLSANVPPTTDPVTYVDGTIRWTYRDADGDPQKAYQVAVWTGPGGTGEVVWDPGAVSSSAGSVSYGGPPLKFQVTYYARVKAFDGKVWGQWYETAFSKGVGRVLEADVNKDGRIGKLEDYHLIGVPGIIPANPDPLGVFGAGQESGYTPSRLRLFQYEPAGQDYVEYPDLTPVAPGQGFWAITAIDRQLAVSGQFISDTTPYTVTVAPGWNMVGYPFLGRGALEDVVVRYREGGEWVEVPLGSQVDLKVEKEAWGYRSGYFAVRAGGAGLLDEWQAYWMNNVSSENVQLLFYPSGTVPASPRTTASSVLPSLTQMPGGISFILSEKGRGYRDRTLFLGLDDRASKGLDSLDCTSPPPVSKLAPRIYVNHGKWKVRPGQYAVDVRPPDALPEDFHVRLELPPRKGATRYVLRWKEIGTLPGNLKVSLEDPTNRRKVNMRKQSSYEFPVPAGKKRLAFIVRMKS